MQTMRINEVQAQVRYSSEVRGSWVTIELGSTASLTNSEEILESVSDELYQRLTKQLKALWVNSKAGGSEPQAEALSEAKGQTPNPNWCAEHHTEFKQFSKNGNSWFSHKIADGTWHNRGN
jgi:hypothetical protein